MESAKGWVKRREDTRYNCELGEVLQGGGWGLGPASASTPPWASPSYVRTQCYLLVSRLDVTFSHIDGFWGECSFSGLTAGHPMFRVDGKRG